MHLSAFKDKDLGGWVEVGKLFIILMVIMGARNCFGVFFTSLEEHFSLSRGTTSGFFSIYMALASFFTILSGWALDRYGAKVVLLTMGILVALSLLLTGRAGSPWQLYFTYSLLLAAGTGGGFTLVLASVSRWFVRHRGMALGVALSGEGAGTLAVAPLAAFLISGYDWRTAFSVIGVIAGAVIIGFSLLLKKVPRDSGPASDGLQSSGAANASQRPVQPSGFSLVESMSTRSFWLLGSVYLLFSLSFHLALTHIAPHATDLEITPARAAFILALMGGSTIPGRLVIGWASDRANRKKLAVFCALFQAAAMFWLVWSQSPWMFYVFAVGFGFAFGGLSNLMATLISDTFGMTNLGAITGALVVGFSIGAAIGPALGGFSYDASGSYLVSFLIGTGASIAAALFLMLTRRETRQSSKNTDAVYRKGDYTKVP